MLLKELKISLQTVPTIWCDNVSTISLASNPVFHARTKHIELDYHFIHEKVHIFTDEQPADVLTKPLPIYKFHKFRSKLCVFPLTLLRGDVK